MKRISKRKPLNKHILAFLFLLFFSLPKLISLGGNMHSMWDLTIPPFSPSLQMRKAYYVWDYSFLGGRYYVMLFNAPIMLMFSLLSNVMSMGTAFTIVHWLLFLSAGLSMYLFSFSKLKESRYAKFGAISAALLYMYNPFWILRQNVTFYTIYILAFLPLVLLFLDNALSLCFVDNKKSFLYILGATLLSILMYPGLANLPVGFATQLFVSIFIVTKGFAKKRFFPAVFILVVYIGLFVITNLWWIYPNLWHPAVQESITRSGTYIKDSLDSLSWWTNNGYVNYRNIFRNLAYYIHDKNMFTSSRGSVWIPTTWKYNETFLVGITFLIPIFALSGFTNSKRKTSTTAKAMLVSFITIFPLLAMAQGMFKDLTLFLFVHVPFYPLRRPPSYMFIISFIYAYLFGYSTITFIDIYINPIKSFLKRTIYMVLLASILFSVILLISYPEWRGYETYVNLVDERKGIVNVSSRVTVPDYVTQTSNYINGQDKAGGVLVLPRGGIIRGYDWNNGYFGWDYYYLTLDRPVMSQAIDRYPMFDVYMAINDSISDNLDIATFNNFLNATNIRYVLVAGDSLRHNDTGPFNISVINERLSSNASLQLVFETKNTWVYENINCLNYCNELYIPEGIAPAVTDSVDPESFIRNIALLSNGIDLIPSEYYPTSLSRQHKLSFTRVSPVEYTVRIDDPGSGNVYIGSKIKYHEGWEAFVNGEKLAHYISNGLYNGWIYEPKKDNNSDPVEISIVFRYQDTIDKFLLISFVGTFLCIIFVVVLAVKNNNRKQIIIAFFGSDGSGKSTQIDLLKKSLIGRGLSVKVIHMFSKNSTKMSKLHESRGMTRLIKYLRNNKSNPLISIISLFLRILNVVIDSTFTKPPRAEDVVIYDRYFYDVIAVIMHDYPKLSWVIGLVLKIIRKPDLSLNIKVAPSISSKRKKDHTLEDANIYYAIYSKISHITESQVIEGDRSVNDISQDILSSISEII